VVRNAPAFLATTTTRLAINAMRSARSRRETMVGSGLPEPVDTRADPAVEAERGEALELVVLMLIEKMSPAERSVFVLREAFDLAYRDIANVLGLQEANARQVVTRARQRVASDRQRPGSSTRHRRFIEPFVAAIRSGDIARLEGATLGRDHTSRQPAAP
jgi:RNA polymerase sigma-70 factor (ECF subfamily)